MYTITESETRFLRDTVKDATELNPEFSSFEDCLEILEGILEHGKRIELEEASE